jgi:tetratricopeptide (TPR) repeat protein
LKNMQLSKNKKYIWLFLLPLILACNLVTDSPEPTPLVETPQVVISPSSMPPPTLSPTTESEAPPATEVTPVPETANPQTTVPAVLPASLYFLNTNNQIMRLAADGLTLTQITNEAEDVTDFDVSPEIGRIVYVSGNNLIETDLNGDNRILKVLGEPLNPDIPDDFITIRISSPRYSPEGSRISFGLNGLNIIPSGPETDYEVVVPSDPYPDFNNNPGPSEGNPIRFFTSGEWSPDGTKLAVSFTYFPEGGGLAIKNLDDGSLIDLNNSIPGLTCCNWTWTADSSTGYIASNLLAYGSPGLVRFDAATGQGTTIVRGLPPEGIEPGPENPIRLFTSAYPTADGSILSFVDAANTFDEFVGPSVYTMHRISLDGSTITPIRTDSHPIWEALWAKDGSGAIIVDTQFDQRYPPTGPLRWLPTDGGPILELPAHGSQLRWGKTAPVTTPENDPTANDFANLKSLYLSDFRIELSEVGISDLYYSRFNLGDGRSLWYMHTLGLRDFSNQNHSLGIYAFESGAWQQLAAYNFPGFDNPDEVTGPDILNIGAVKQTFIEPTNGWLVVDGNIGVHGGTYHVFRFDGQSLTLEAANANGNPGAGRIEDINGDDQQEVLLDLTSFYVFAYAAGVRIIEYEILKWDGSDLVKVELTRLDNTNQAAEVNNQAIDLAQAELWKDARMIINEAVHQEPDNEIIRWNEAVIETIADARENARSSYPLMDWVFFGDYEAVLNNMRTYAPSEIFSRQSPLIVGTSAEGSEASMAETIQTFTSSALALRPDMASAYFLRGWAIYLRDQNVPAALADVQKAAELAPDDPLFASALAYLQSL